jgi:hypothetical protein
MLRRLVKADTGACVAHEHHKASRLVSCHSAFLLEVIQFLLFFLSRQVIAASLVV